MHITLQKFLWEMKVVKRMAETIPLVQSNAITINGVTVTDVLYFVQPDDKVIVVKSDKTFNLIGKAFPLKLDNEMQSSEFSK